MTNDFSDVMARQSDKQLAEILTIKREEYQETAIEAAQNELSKRGLDVNTLISSVEIEEANRKKLPITKEEQKLSLVLKILTFLFPGYTKPALNYLWIQLSDSIYIGFWAIPIIILFQITIYKLLLDKGYITIAANFKQWSSYSWIPFGILYVAMPYLMIAYYFLFY
jgi:hypothetical protein